MLEAQENKIMNKIELEPTILQWCYSFDFLKSFCAAIEKSPDRSLKDFYSEWHEKCHFQQEGVYPLANTLGVYLGGLFVLLVCPKQSSFDQIPKLSFDQLNAAKWGICDIRKWGRTDRNLRGFIRRMRNALSHFRITVEEEASCNKIIFRDQKDQKGTDDFEVVYESEELDKFIFRFARSFMFDDWKTD